MMNSSLFLGRGEEVDKNMYLSCTILCCFFVGKKMKTKLSVTFASTDFRNKGGVASVLWRKATIADCYIEIPSVRRRRLATNNNKIEVEIYGKDNS